MPVVSSPSLQPPSSFNITFFLGSFVSLSSLFFFFLKEGNCGVKSKKRKTIQKRKKVKEKIDFLSSVSAHKNLIRRYNHQWNKKRKQKAFTRDIYFHKSQKHFRPPPILNSLHIIIANSFVYTQSFPFSLPFFFLFLHSYFGTSQHNPKLKRHSRLLSLFCVVLVIAIEVNTVEKDRISREHFHARLFAPLLFLSFYSEAINEAIPLSFPHLILSFLPFCFFFLAF